MFTGVISAVGTVKASRKSGDGRALTVQARFDEPFEIGEWIAVDGARLEVVGFQDDKFQVEVDPDTLGRSTLGARSVRDRVNLERALRVGDRLRGHVVTGLVDGTGAVAATEPDGDSVRCHVALSPDLLRYCVARGRLAIDGVSVRIEDINDAGGTVEVRIPSAVRASTTLRDRKVGADVNVEVDLLSRYVERLLGSGSRDPERARTLPGAAAPVDLDPTMPPDPGSLR